MTNKDITPELLQRYLQHNCTPEEEVLVDEWYAAQDDKDFEVDDAFMPDTKEEGRLERRMLTQIKDKLKNTGAYSEKVRASRSMVPFTTLYRVAAGILFFIAAGLGIYWLLYQDPAVEHPMALNERHIVNTTKTILRQALPDGSIVWLQPASKIVYPEAFSTKERTLKLIGEAFFSISRDTLRPFSISTGNVVTRVLGTSFNISAYEHSPSIEVSVMTGKVSVKLKDTTSVSPTDKSPLLLTPHQRGRYVKAENRFEKHEDDKLPELGIWQVTNFVFDNAPVSDVVDQLSKKFGVHIRVRNQNLLNCLIRADFTNQNLPDILEMLSMSVEATYQIEGNIISLMGDGCPS